MKSVWSSAGWPNEYSREEVKKVPAWLEINKQDPPGAGGRTWGWRWVGDGASGGWGWEEDRGGSREKTSQRICLLLSDQYGSFHVNFTGKNDPERLTEVH